MTFLCEPPDIREFDAWRWTDYWVDINNVIEFKREVYGLALNELARYLPQIKHVEGSDVSRRVATITVSK